MPSVLSSPLTPGEAADALKLMHVEFEYLLDSLKVEKEVQAKLASLGYIDKTVFG